MQLIDDSTMNIDRLIIRLRRNQDHPTYDEDDDFPPNHHQRSPPQQYSHQLQYQQDLLSQQQEEHYQHHADKQQAGVISDAPITHEYAQDEQVHHHEHDLRYSALQSECTDLRRQLTMLHERMNAWKTSRVHITFLSSFPHLTIICLIDGLPSNLTNLNVATPVLTV